MATNPFSQSPFGGGPKKDGAGSTAKKQDLPYEATGVATRDNVRKSFWEIFSADPEEADAKLKNAEVVHLLENQLFEATGGDAKTRQYRDKTKAIQLKLRGSRYSETRARIRMQDLSVEEVCTDEFLNAKAAPAGAGRGAAAPRGAMPPGRGRGIMPGPPGRGRGVPPPAMMGRGRGLPGAAMPGGVGRGAPMPRPGMPQRAPMPPAQPQPESTAGKQEEQLEKPEKVEQAEKIVEELKEAAVEEKDVAAEQVPDQPASVSMAPPESDQSPPEIVP